MVDIHPPPSRQMAAEASVPQPNFTLDLGAGVESSFISSLNTYVRTFWTCVLKSLSEFYLYGKEEKKEITDCVTTVVAA